MVSQFNEHFIHARSVLDTMNVNTSVSCYATTATDRNHNLFDLKLSSGAQVCKALRNIDHKTAAGPDNMDPHLLKMVADNTAEPITHLL